MQVPHRHRRGTPLNQHARHRAAGHPVSATLYARGAQVLRRHLLRVASDHRLRAGRIEVRERGERQVALPAYAIQDHRRTGRGEHPNHPDGV